MSIAILPISQQFQWSSATIGLVQSSFFWGYLLTQVHGPSAGTSASLAVLMSGAGGVSSEHLPSSHNERSSGTKVECKLCMHARSRWVSSPAGATWLKSTTPCLPSSCAACCLACPITACPAACSARPDFSWPHVPCSLCACPLTCMPQVAGGVWADRFGGKRVLGLGVVWWSVATVLTPIAARMSLPVLLAARACMGIGEGVAMPAMNNLLSK